MNKKLYRLFDDLSPSQGDDELLDAVLRKAEKTMEKKRSLKKLLLIPAVALVLTIGTVGVVGAAYDWDLTKAFDEFFQNINDSEKTYSSFDFSESGKELGATLDAEHCDIVVKGVLADTTHLYLLYDVVFDKDFDCATSMTADWSNWMLNTTLSVNGSPLTTYGLPVYGGCRIATINGNVYTACSDWDITEIGTFNTGDDITITFESMERYGYSDDDLSKEEVVTFTDTAINTTLDFDVTEKARTTNVDQPIRIGKYSGTLDSISVNSFSLSWQITYDTDIMAMYNDDTREPVTISYTDIYGNTSQICSGITSAGSSPHNIEASRAEWNFPVNLGDISSITIGNVTVELK